MARVQYEADKYISNTDSLMSEIGDISTGNIKSIIAVSYTHLTLPTN